MIIFGWIIDQVDYNALLKTLYVMVTLISVSQFVRVKVKPNAGE